jgi:hypothetical protein
LNWDRGPTGRVLVTVAWLVVSAITWIVAPARIVTMFTPVNLLRRYASFYGHVASGCILNAVD